MKRKFITSNHKAVRFIAHDQKGFVVDIIEVAASGVYTFDGKFREAPQRYIDGWLFRGYSVTREEILK